MDNTEFTWTDGTVADFLSELDFGKITTKDGGYYGAINQFKASKAKSLEYEIVDYRTDGEKKKVIISIRRLIDNAVFSIGEVTQGGTIKKFEQLTNTLKVWLDTGWINLHELKKATPKPVLITTMDGIEYREGERKKIWCVNNQFWTTESHPEYYPQLSEHYQRFFSTQEAAQAYVDYNSKKFSAKDICAVTAKYGFSIVPFENEIIELAKSKNK